jgi:hypothetical protein
MSINFISVSSKFNLQSYKYIINTKYNLLHHKDGMLISHSFDTLTHAELA